MKISVIIPTYNDRLTLNQTVESILNQSHRDLEVIVVNDAGEAPRNFLFCDDTRLQIVNLPKNGGVSAARNVGLAKATGELVYFLDADDLAAPDMLKFAARILEDSTAGVLVIGKTDIEDSDMEVPFIFPKTPRTEVIEAPSREKFFRDMRDRSGLFLPSAAIFVRKRIISCLGTSPWAQGLTHSEDTLIFMSVGYDFPVLLCRDKMVIYRRRQGSASKKELLSWKGRTAAMDILLPWLASRKAPADIMAIARHMRQNSARRVARLMGAEGNRREARQILLQDLRAGFSGKTALVLLAMLKP